MYVLSVQIYSISSCKLSYTCSAAYPALYAKFPLLVLHPINPSSCLSFTCSSAYSARQATFPILVLQPILLIILTLLVHQPILLIMPNIPYLFCVLSYSSSNLFLYIRPKLFKSICFCFLHIPAIYISLALSNWVLQNTWVELLKIHTVKSMCFCFTYSDNLHKFGALNWGLQNTWAALSRMYMVKDICFRTKTYTVRSMYFSFLYLGGDGKIHTLALSIGSYKTCELHCQKCILMKIYVSALCIYR